jgi:hypothetical protein
MPLSTRQTDIMLGPLAGDLKLYAGERFEMKRLSTASKSAWGAKSHRVLRIRQLLNDNGQQGSFSGILDEASQRYDLGVLLISLSAKLQKVRFSSQISSRIFAARA